uniref:Myb/SANT-like DNA-binding domain-containing protein n=1 Tax=Cajanus cajan TaxID=3821 RepID=A0A151S3A2_CAJCA|nr:hypothetical protein KK1_028953 [Cajanus cajan]
MDDMEDDARYPPKSFSLIRQNPSHRHKHPLRGGAASYHRPLPPRYEEPDDFDDGNEDPDDFDDAEDDEENGYDGAMEENDVAYPRIPKKRKVSVTGGGNSYEFAPRVKFSYGSGSGSEEWNEHETLVLLEVWGEKFLQLGRNSLRLEEWNEVAEKVSEELKVERSVAQCRSVLDKLKRRYKKEKARVDEMGLGSCKWAFFKKMDMFMASSARQEVYLNRSNGFDEMRDSPGESESDEDDDDDCAADDHHADEEDQTSFRALADSIHKFGKIYEKIENSKRQQMMELEKMRLDFNRELELQKKQILERAQAEIAKIQEGDQEVEEEEEDDTDTSAENLSE